MGSFGAGLGAAAGNLERNWDADRQTKRDIMKAKVIHDFNMTGRKFTQGAMDKRATERQAHERGLLTDRTAANQAAAELNQKQRTDAASLSNSQANARQDRQIANKGSESMTDADGNVWERRPGGGTLTKTMTQTGPTQYEGGDDQALADPEFGVSPGLLSGMQNKGKREQLNTGKPESPEDKHRRKVEIEEIKNKLGSGSGGGSNAKLKHFETMLKLKTPWHVARGVAMGTIKPMKDKYGYETALVDLASGTTMGTLDADGIYTENPEWAKQSQASGGGQGNNGPSSREEAIAGLRKAHPNATNTQIEEAIQAYFPQFGGSKAQ